ncbi:MAG TPA: HNH endonuclease [Verrucomicrobiae bacterium]|nr:HNH endonuclease [Verrucomicrobiae bacterium]
MNIQQWKNEVLERDDYTCQNCGAQTCLDAAHIQSRGSHPELAHDPNNGITLCRTCHAYFHTEPRAFEKFIHAWQIGATNPQASIDRPPSASRHGPDKRFTDRPDRRQPRQASLFTEDWIAKYNAEHPR